MKAAIYDNPGPPSVLVYADVPRSVVRTDEVLVSLEAISIEGGDRINRRSTSQLSGGLSGTPRPEPSSGRKQRDDARRVHLWQPMQNNQTLHGVFMGPLLERPAGHRTVEDLFEAAAAGEIEVVIDRTFALRDVRKALDYAETGRPLGRVIMTP